MQRTMCFDTGYESKLPLGSDLKIFRGMVQRGKEKKEVSYLSYILQLYSHVPLALIKWLKLNSFVGEFEQEVLKLPCPIQRIQVLNKIYLACRCIDDVYDGDSPKLLSPKKIRHYSQVAEDHFTREVWDFNFVPDKYFSRALELCREISVDIKQQVLKVLQSMNFDAERRARFLETGEIDFIAEKELQEHYYQLDIEGTIGSMLVLVNEEDSPENRMLIQPLGELVRIYYDIQDLGKETRQGLVNISKEDAEIFGITKETLQEWAKSKQNLIDAPQEILEWAKVKMREAEILLAHFRRNLEAASFKTLTRMFFEKQYIRHYETFKRDHAFLLS